MPSARVKKSGEKFLAVVQRYFDMGLMSHAAFFCGRLQDDSGEVFIECTRDQNNTAQIYDLSSLSKALATAPLTHKFLTEQDLALETKLLELKQRFKFDLPSYLDDVTIRSLLSHTSGLPAWRNFWVNRLDDKTASEKYRNTRHAQIEAVFKRYDASIIGRAIDLYSDLNFIILGYILERATAKDLSQLFALWCRELQLDEKTPLLYPVSSERSALLFVPSGFCPLRARELCGEVHDENAAALGGIAGHSGLFGSLSGVVSYLKTLYRNEAGLKMLSHLRISDGVLGWRLGDDKAAMEFGSGAAIGHYGFTGTAFWLVPETGACVVLLTNRIISARINPLIKDFRRECFALAQQFLQSETRL